MIDIGSKRITRREAIVGGRIQLKASVVRLIKKRNIPKGDCLEAARLAGILAAKKTPEMIPLCHPIPIEFVDVKFYLKNNAVEIRTTVRGQAKTGVEMEALVATSVAALTIYDMCKMFDKDMVIGDIRLLKKTGGKSGAYVRK